MRVSSPDVQGLFVWWLGDDVSRIWRVASRYHLSPEEVELAFGIEAPKQRARRAGSGQSRIEVVEVWTAETFELWVGPSSGSGQAALIEKKANPY
ncbi:MAG: hypothetical protein V3S20_09105, partial [Dehalococcoidia bacterium]